MLAAAQRGVQVDLMIDGFGSPDLSPEFIDGPDRLPACKLRVFDPGKRLFGQRAQHACAACTARSWSSTASLAFVGGINYSADHLLDFGPKAKQDYAVELARADRRRDPSLRAARHRGRRQGTGAGSGAALSAVAASVADACRKAKPKSSS